MDKITKNEVISLAKLARVGLSDEEVDSLSVQMTEILNYAHELDEVNVDGVDATSQVTGLTNVYRKDEAIPTEIPLAELLENAPETQDDYIKVKSVL